MKRASAFVAVGLMLAGASAEASPGEDLARARVAAIAAGNVGAITAQYAQGATLHWVGGPLDGTYTGGQLSEVWSKFGAANGSLQAAISGVAESANPKGSTVAANVVFSGKSTVKVRYVLVYREGKLVDEIWQIDPNLPAAH